MFMKKRFVLCGMVMIFLSASVFCEDLFWNQKYGGSLTYESLYLIENGEIRIYIMTPEGYRYETVTEEMLAADEDGYFRTSLFGGNQIFLYGGNFVLLAERGEENYSVYNPDVSLAKLAAKGAFKREKYGIAKISAGTFLTEGTGKNRIEYSPDGLNDLFYSGWLGFRWNDTLVPWAEGEEGPGIGTELTVEFTEPKDHVLIINGFVDFARPHLYKANNRIKICRVRSADGGELFEFIGEFEDVVKLHEFSFPRPADRIIIEICEVYPGRKWDDTVITGILTREPRSVYTILSRQVGSALPYQ